MDQQALSIYATLDLRRALWIPESTGAMIVCSYRSDLLPMLREKGHKVWCFEEEFPEAEVPKSTFLLLSRALTLNALRELKRPLEFLVFKPSNKIREWVEKQGWKLLASDVRVCRQLEDKLIFPELCKQYELPMPRQEEVLWNPADLDEYHDRFGDQFVVQGRMGHAGSSSYVIRKNDHALELQMGTRVKLVEWIEGNTYTLNAHVDEIGKLRLGPLWQQVMGVSQWNRQELGTVGVTPSDLDGEIVQQLHELLHPLAELMKSLNYSGFFGLDLIWNGSQWYLIECNPRFTASVSLQSLEDIISKKPSLLMPVEESETDQPQNNRLIPKYSQLILKNSLHKVWKTPKSLKSGIYRHDGEAWQLTSRSYDARELEDGDMLLILSRLPGTRVDPGSDYASLQMKGRCLDETGQLLETVMDFYERVVREFIIRPHEKWSDRYAQVSEKAPLWQKPVPSADTQMPARLQHAELREGEVLQLYGEHQHSWFVKKMDGTKGWLSKAVELDESVDSADYEMPHKASCTADEFLQHWKGTPYQWGGGSEEGIDCSGFVQRYFWEVEGRLLPKHSQDQRAFCQQKVKEDELNDDDLVFMHNIAKKVAHVGIWREGLVWHSSLETGVICQNLEDLQQRYALEEFRRL